MRSASVEPAQTLDQGGTPTCWRTLAARQLHLPRRSGSPDVRVGAQAWELTRQISSGARPSGPAILTRSTHRLTSPAAVLLTGDAGIGKTAIWESIVAQRRAAGDHVLISRATSAEARLPWVGMTDLLRAMPPDALGVAARPAAAGARCRVAASRRTRTGGTEALDERVVGTAFLSALQAAASTAPVLLAVDDLPYLDAASASAVAFALRRMEGPRAARLLATVRGDDLRLPVLQGLPSDRCAVIPVGPLTLGALFDLLQTRRGIRLARPLLLRVHETSGGNPLYALELARALDRLEISPKAGTPLPVPAGLNALVDARVRDLPVEVAEVVAATAAAWRVNADDQDPEAVEHAVAAGMVVVDEPAVVGGTARDPRSTPTPERSGVQRADERATSGPARAARRRGR